MYELLDAAGATLCDPLLIILLAVMMMPSGGSSYVFSGKTDDVARRADTNGPPWGCWCRGAIRACSRRDYLC